MQLRKLPKVGNLSSRFSLPALLKESQHLVCSLIAKEFNWLWKFVRASNWQLVTEDGD